MNSTHLHFSAFRGRRLHLGVCGSVAAYKVCDLLRGWVRDGISTSATLTDGARQFVTPLSFAALGALPVYGRLDDATEAPADEIFAHLEPGQRAQAMIIAPASADALSRLANGAASDMLSAQALAFSGPLVIAPAMNPRMWAHPAVRANVAILQERGAMLVRPGCGATACGDMGEGRLADLREIHVAALRALAPQDMAGLRVMITLGPTREVWDGVRYWTNPSSGRMGASLAVAAWLRGARVDAVCGPGAPWLPQGICRHDVVSARDMLAAAEAVWDAADMGVFTAAVADFSPVSAGPEKFKKEGAADGFSVRFTANPDILKTLAARRSRSQRIMGFAAETAADLAACVRRKLASKGADMIVGNNVNQQGAGFGAPDNTVLVLDRNGREERWPARSKADIAWDLCTWLLSL